jgi:large subunit ribosomal protein L9
VEVILLERVGRLGHMGETVRVKDGFARNFLLPRGKALRATEANKKKFEGQRAELEHRNSELKGDAAGKSTKIDGQSYIIIRQAGETGQLYGSVSARDIAEAISATVGFAVHRNHVSLLQPIKALGLYKTPVHLHPEVEAHVTVNVARSPEQAERQAKGEDLTVREQTTMDDLGLEVGKALAEAGPGESLGRE